MNPKRWLTLALLAAAAIVATAHADDVTKNEQYTITRATLNAGDDAQPTVLVCERVGLRLTPNVAEVLGGPDVLINVDDKGKPIYRLRIGLFTPSRLNADNLDCNHNGILDACEPDCNANDIPDDCDIDEGRSEDCNFRPDGSQADRMPDECQSLKGDMNCDHSVDFDDINCFVAALAGCDIYVKECVNCDCEHADIDCNGYVSFNDIDPFVELLIAGCGKTCE